MEGEDRGQPESIDFWRDQLLRGWILLAGILVVFLSALWILAVISDALRPDFEVLSDPPVFQLDVNLATAAQLQALPDVGSRLAERIVNYREEHGPFRGLHELQDVRGVGPATLKRLQNMLVFSPSDLEQLDQVPENQLSSNE